MAMFKVKCILVHDEFITDADSESEAIFNVIYDELDKLDWNFKAQLIPDGYMMNDMGEGGVL